MSTLRVSTIQDTAGSNSSTPSAIANGIAKAWIFFNGSTISGSYNVSSITIVSTGVIRVNFQTALADTNYAALFCKPYSSSSFHNAYGELNKTTTSIEFNLWENAYQLNTMFYVGFFR